MASRQLYPVGSPRQDRVLISGSIVTASDGSVSSSRGKGFTISKPAGTGIYRVTIDQKVANVDAVVASILKSAVAEAAVQAQVRSASLIDLQVYKGADDRAVAYKKDAADGAASTATSEHSVGRVENASTVAAVHFVPDAALTADNTNYATLTLSKRSSAGASKTTVASRTTQITGSGNWTQFAPVAITVSAGALVAGDMLSFEIAKAGTGVVVPAGMLVIRYTDLRGLDLPSGEVHFKIAANGSSR